MSLQPDNLRATARVIRENADHYDQSMFVHGCGAPSCIAGWAASLALETEDFVAGVIAVSIPEVAKEFLGLNHFQALYLFSAAPRSHWPQPYATEWYEANNNRKLEAEAAARLLEALADEEDLFWPEAMYRLEEV